MAYIGNTSVTTNIQPATDFFSGNGSTVSFTLSRTVVSTFTIEAVINNVQQNPATAYTVSGNTITFTSAPPTGVNNIYVNYNSIQGQVVGIGQGTVGTQQLAAITNIFSSNNNFTLQTGSPSTTALTIDQTQNILMNGTGSLTLPTGTTAQRPSSASPGMVRQNVTTGTPEFYNVGNSSWSPFNSGSLIRAPQILVSGTSYTTPVGCRNIYVECVGGGGGGGQCNNGLAGGCAGGGGGAGFTAKYFTVTPSTTYSYTIGSGGGNSGGGGTTTFTVSGTTISANGGGAGTTSGPGPAGWPGGAGGSGSGGDINMSGGGGGAAPPTYISGNGGSAAGIGGGGGEGRYYSAGGAPGNSGGGGGGACGPGSPGGSGGTGFIRIWEFI